MVVLQVGACGCGFFLAEACQRVFDPILLSCAKKSGVEPPRRSCGESCCAAAQPNKRAAALLKILGVSTICTDEKRKCLRLRRHSLAVLRLRWISVRLQRSDCRAANLWCRPPRRSLSSARASAVRVRWKPDAPSKGSPCGKGSCQRQLTEGIERWSAAETVQMRFTPGNLTNLPRRPRA